MAEKEYIEREARLKEIDRAFKEYEQNGDILRLFSECRASIIYAPAADVVEVVHGEWLPVSDDDQYEGEYHCSRCNAEEFIPDRSPFPPYCWQCGARMDGERKEATP